MVDGLAFPHKTSLAHGASAEWDGEFRFGVGQRPSPRGPQFPEHLLSMLLMECTLIVTEVAVPDLARESELVLKVGDSTPVTSTSCPRYGPNLNFFVP